MDSGIDHPVGSLGVLVITIPNYWFTEAWNPGDLILIDQANHIAILSLILWQIIGAGVISMTKFSRCPGNKLPRISPNFAMKFVCKRTARCQNLF